MDTRTAIAETKREFPFGQEYMAGKEEGYQQVADILNEYSSERSADVLSIGSGPCDFEAVFSKIGYNVTAVDDLSDAWHKIGKNQDRIIDFVEQQGIDFHKTRLGTGEVVFEEKFDIVCILDVIEHLDNPRNLLNVAGQHLKDNGWIVVLTPNAAHLANRMKLLLGKPVSKDAEFFFWNIGPYRAHIKEYTIEELQTILQLSGFQDVNTRTVDKLAGNVASNTNSVMKKFALEIYQAITSLRPTFKDTQIAIARKPVNWSPTGDSIDHFAQQYNHIEKYNIDNLDLEEIYQVLNEQPLAIRMQTTAA